MTGRTLQLTLVVLGISASVSPAWGDDRPNLIWIMADDLGYGELGCYGQKSIHTPQLDEMARQGMRFTQFYAGATVCAPSRSVLMTGQHQGHTRVRGNGGGRAQSLQPEDVTVAEILQQAGYRTALFGKWGLGDIGPGESGLPGKQGFDEFFGYLNQNHAHNHFPDFLWRNEERVPLPNDLVATGKSGAGYATAPVQYADDLFAEAGLKFVAENQDRPFFLYWSLVAPHSNNERAKGLQNGTEVPDLGVYAENDWPAPDKGHAAMISRMDADVGRLLHRLRELKLDQKTLVIFTSDNGPHDESQHDLQRFQPSGPYSGIKRSLKDGGIRVPMIAWWPGHVLAGSVSDHAAYFGDFMATAAELAGVAVPPECDSLSLTPTLLNRPGQQQHEFLYWEFHERGFQQAALFQGRWKGIRRGSPQSPLQLFDQQSDPAEVTDVADQHPEIAQRLDQYLKQARTAAPDWVPHWSDDKQNESKPPQK